MSPLLNDARRLWVSLAAAPVAFIDGGLDIAVSPQSMLCPPSWVGVVALGTAAIATAPDEGRADRLRRAWTDFDHLEDNLTCVDVLGPASLAYLAPDDFRPPRRVADVGGDLAALFEASAPADVNESRIDEITSPAFTVADGGVVVAAAGYRTWLDRAAHISVLTAPAHRGRGLAAAVAGAAAADALAHGLLPQWRTRVEQSRRVARILGFRELGAQISVKLAED